MAELAFRVQADYEEVIRLRGELVRLRDEMLRVDTSTEQGRKRLSDLQATYTQTSAQLKVVAENASNYAVRLRQMSESASKLEDAFKFGRSFDGSKKVIKDWIKDLSSDLNQIKQQIKDSKIGLAADEELRAGLERQKQYLEQTLAETRQTLAAYNAQENEAIGRTLDPLFRAMQEKARAVESIQKEIDSIGDDWIGKAQALQGMRSMMDTIDRSDRVGNQRWLDLNQRVTQGMSELGLTSFVGEDGDWTRAFDELAKVADGDLSSVEAHLYELQEAQKLAREEADKATEAYEREAKAAEQINDTDFNQMTEKINATEESLAKVNSQLDQLGNGKIGSGKTIQELETLEQKEEEVEAKLKGFRERLKDDRYHKNTFAGMTQGLQGLLGAYTAASGILVQFGADEENLQKIQTKLQGSMSMLIGLQQVFNALQSESAFRTKILDKAMLGLSKAYVKVAASSTLAKLGVAGVAIAAVAALVAITAALSKHAKAQKETREHIKKTSAAASDQLALYLQLQKKWKDANGDLEKQNDLLKSSKMGKLALDIKDVVDAEKAFVQESDKYINTLIKQAEAEIYLEEAKEYARKAAKEYMTADEKEERYNSGKFIGFNPNNRIPKKYRAKGDKYKEQAIGKLNNYVEVFDESTEGGGTNPEAEEKAAREYKYNTLVKDQERQRRRQIEDAEMETRSLRIGLMKDTAAKELAQLKFDFDRENKMRERQKEDRLKQLQDEEKAKWLAANPNRKEYEFKPTITALPDSELAQYDAQAKLSLQKYNKAKEDLLSVYGTISERRNKLVKEWDIALSGVVDKNLRKILETERDIELSTFDYDNIVDSGKIDEIAEKWRAKIIAEAQKIADPEVAARYIAKGEVEIASMIYENAAKYGTKSEMIQAFRDKMEKEANTIVDEAERKVFRLQGEAQIAQMTYGNINTYETYDDALKAEDAIYQAKKKEAQAREDDIALMEIEKQHYKDLYDLAIKFNGDLAMVFGNVANYTLSQIEKAREIANKYLAENTNLSAEQLKAVHDQLNEMAEREAELATRVGNGDWRNLFNNRRVLQFRQGQKSQADYVADTLREEIAYENEKGEDADQEKIARLKKELSLYEDESKQLAILIEQLKDEEELDKKAVAAQLVADGINMIADSVSRLGEAMGDESMKDMGAALSDLGNIANSMIEGFKSGDWLGAILAGATTVLTGIFDAIVESIAATEQYKESIKSLHETFRQLALDKQMTDGLDSIFGVDKAKQVDNYLKVMDEVSKHQTTLLEDYKKARIAAIKTLNPSMAAETDQLQRLQKKAQDAAVQNAKDSINSISRLEDVQITTLKTKGFLGIGAKNQKESLATLAEKTGADLYDKNGMLNADFLKELLNTYGDLTKEEKTFIEQAIADSEAYGEAIDGLKDQLRNLFGNMSSQLADATIEGLRYGATRGSEEMKRIMSSTAQELQKQMVQTIYNRYLEQYTDRAMKIMTEDNGDERKLLDLYTEMFDNMEMTIDVATRAAMGFEEYAESKGYDMGGLNNVSASSKGTESISESTGSVIEGRMASLQIDGATRTQLVQMMDSKMTEAIVNMQSQVRIAEDIRSIQSDAYLAILQIRDNTGENRDHVKAMHELMTSIEKSTRNL